MRFKLKTMPSIKNIILCITIIFFATSCIESGNKESIVGDWKGTEWLVNGNPSEYDATKVFFSFSTTGGYTADFGGDKEKGTYVLRDDKLFITDDEQLEVMVLISKLTKDSLVIDMNRSGQPETLTLIKK